jgi:hypothetical protein
MGKDKGYNSSHVYCQVKGWSKKSYEIFSNDFWKEFLEWYDGGEENGLIQKGFQSCNVFLLSKY